MSTTSRRSLFAATTAVVMGSGIAAGVAASVAGLAPPERDDVLMSLPASDAAVIRLCGELIELETIKVGIYDGPNRIVDDEEAGRVAAPGQVRAREVIMELGTVRAATAAGVLARARALAAFGGDFGFSFDWPKDEGAGRLLALLLRDAAVIGTPLPKAVIDPDQLRGEA